MAASPLAALGAERGDIDSVAIAPTGIAFAMRPRRARSTHATWPTPARRPRGFIGIGGAGAVRGALPVLCVVRARGVEHVEDEVLVVSLDRLAPALRAGAGTSPRPRFLAAQTSSG